MKISINTIITNASRLENVSGRDFVVVDGLATHGNSSMNGSLYTTAVVSRKAPSLEGKPTPLSHPERDGMKVSAEDFFSKGAFDIGGKVMRSTMSGDKNIAKIFIDKEFAERTEGGKELVRKLLAGEEVGLSTGLFPTKTHTESGVDQFGVAFNEVIDDFEYDHLAFLIDETPAGVAAGTKIIYNSETGDSLEVITHSSDPLDNKKKVRKMFELDTDDLSKPDRVKLESMTAKEIILKVNAKEKAITIEDAQTLLESKGLKVNSADSVILTAEQHEELKTNADLFKAAETERVDEIKQSIMTNSKMEESDLEGMNEAALTKFANALTPENDFSISDGVTTNADKSGEFEQLEGM